MANKDSPNWKPKGTLANSDPTPFNWTKQKRQVAACIAEGKYYLIDIAQMNGMSHQTLSKWRQNMEFMAFVDELTLEFELATKAGLLRECFAGIEQKRDEIFSDKSTHLDYVKAVAKIQGLEKSEIELNGKVIHELSTEDALRQYEALLEKLAESE